MTKKMNSNTMKFFDILKIKLHEVLLFSIIGYKSN